MSYIVGTTKKLLAASDGKIWSALEPGAPVALKTGFLSNVWQSVIFFNASGSPRLVMVNGRDTAQQYDGTTLSDAVYTGVASTDLITVQNYRHRLYFIKNSSLSVWYGAVDAVTGALTEFSVANEVSKGGSLVYAGPWNTFASGMQQSTFVFITNRGEVVTYSGSYPGDANWSLIGRYQIPMPLGFRSFMPYTSDQVCMLFEGAIPLSLTAAPDAQSAAQTRINDKVATRWNDLVRDFYGAFGWCSVYHPRANMFLFNLPVSGTTYEQHIQNVVSGAWCRFTFSKARHWVVHDNNLYYGSTDGKVIQVDIGTNDLGENIPWQWQLSFNNLGVPDVEKRLQLVLPTIRSTYPVQIVIDADLDLTIRPTTLNPIPIQITGTAWNSPWNSPWSQKGVVNQGWQGVSGVGESFSLKSGGQSKGTEIEFSAFRVMFEPGGIL